MKKQLLQFVLLPLFWLMISVLPVFAEIKAEIVDLEGTISISRRGTYLDENEIDYGTEVFSYDIIQTGADGYAEILLETPVSPEVFIRISENTTLFMEHAARNQSSATTLNLYRGAVQTRAATLIQGGELKIKTDSSVMGVRGTIFSVVTAPDTSLLVTCREGKVVCTTDGEDTFIQPGRIYETSSEGRGIIKTLAPEGIDTYISEWKQARLDALMINGAISLEHYAGLYLQSAPGFLETFAELNTKQDIFRKWAKIMEEGQAVSMGEATRDKISLSNGIIRLRSRLPMMEHIYYTLYDLTGIMNQSEQIGQELSETTVRTLDIYEKRQIEFEEKLALSRYYFRIFLEIDRQASGQGLMPSSDIMEDFLLNDSLYITPPEPGFPDEMPF